MRSTNINRTIRRHNMIPKSQSLAYNEPWL